eukprot:scaffold2470_cov158-Amphora_coffeaeformis.AAC.9
MMMVMMVAAIAAGIAQRFCAAGGCSPWSIFCAAEGQTTQGTCARRRARQLSRSFLFSRKKRIFKNNKTMTTSSSSLAIDSQQQAKAIVAALGVLLVTTKFQPIWRAASAILGRLYLNVVVATARNKKRSSDDGDREEIQVSGLYIHPGTNRMLGMPPWIEI